MIYRTPREKILEYYASEALNQSQLVAMSYSLSEYKKKREKQKTKTLYYEDTYEHFLIGSGVDSWMTMGEVSFREDYYLGLLEEKPSPKMMSIVKAVFDTVFGDIEENVPSVSAPTSTIDETNIDSVIDTYMPTLITEEVLPETPAVMFDLKDYEDLIFESVNLHNWHAKWGKKAKVDAVVREGTDYWNELVLARGKQILSAEEYNIIVDIVRSLQGNLRTSGCFKDDDGWDVFFQVPIYFTFDEIFCKALIDIVKVHKVTRQVKLYDLKTMSGRVIDFTESLRKRRYDIQGEWYSKAFAFKGMQSLVNLYNYDIPRSAINHFTLAPFQFIVESTTETGFPLVFSMSNDLKEMAMLGRPILYTDAVSATEIFVMRIRPILGILELLNVYKFYIRNSFSRDFDNHHMSQRANISLDWNGILPIESDEIYNQFEYYVESESEDD